MLRRTENPTAAPFAPSEVAGSIVVPTRLSNWKKLLLFAGPGLLVSVGYMDPGNWATDIQAGSSYGYKLLWVVVLSSLAAMQLQCMSMRLGVATGRDLARLSRDRYAPSTNVVLWILAEISIVACDLAEVLGGALAFKLLLHVSLPVGVLMTALDTVLVLSLRGQGFRRVEAIVLGLVSTIAVCYFVELALIKPVWPDIAAGLWPLNNAITQSDGLFIAIGILGATIMPHNLYLHSSIVNTRGSSEDHAVVTGSDAARAERLRFGRIDTIASLSVALLVNAAILILAGAAFFHPGMAGIADIEDAHRLLEPIAGPGAAILFALALLAAGQSSTFTGTIAGQVIMEGFINFKISSWLRRVITRALALGPALAGVIWLGEHSLAKMLVLSQVVLSLQLPFAMYPLLRFTSDKTLMGRFASTRITALSGWMLFVIITAANLILVWQVVFA
jgi:manganese transport protein